MKEEEEDEEEEKAPEGLRGQCRLPPPALPPSVPLSPPSRRAAPWDAPFPPQHGCGGVTVPPLRERGGGGGEGASRPRARPKGSPLLSPALLLSFPEAARILTGSGGFAEEAKFNPLSSLSGSGWHSSLVPTLGCSSCGVSLPGGVPGYPRSCACAWAGGRAGWLWAELGAHKAKVEGSVPVWAVPS